MVTLAVLISMGGTNYAVRIANRAVETNATIYAKEQYVYPALQLDLSSVNYSDQTSSLPMSMLLSLSVLPLPTEQMLHPALRDYRGQG